jgi:hypothetical protein
MFDMDMSLYEIRFKIDYRPVCVHSFVIISNGA